MEQPPPDSLEGPKAGYVPPPQYTPPQQPGSQEYPLQHQGYPPQHQEYPPQGQGYPPQGQGNQPQNPGLPAKGQRDVQQPTGFFSNSNNTTVVVQNQPQPQTVAAVMPVIDDRMGLSIFACLCCFWPVGIFAIIKSSEARNRYVAGDYAGAVASSQSARNLACAAIICGLIIYPLIIVLRVVVFAAETSSSNNYN